MKKLLAAVAACTSLLLEQGVFAQDAIPVENAGFVGEYRNGGTPQKYGILVLGGSGGGLPSHLANKMADYGHSVLSVAYFKAEGLPSELHQVPLEYFDAPKRWLAAQPDTRNDGLLVAGWSKGAELALLLASRDPLIKGVVGIAPSSVVWAGILNDWTKVPSSSWTDNGDLLAYVPFAPPANIATLNDLYTASLAQVDAVARARIPVEDIAGPILLLSGGLDEIWPANRMAANVCLQRQQADLPCLHVNYPEAGHLLDEEFVIGGTLETNAAANRQAKSEIRSFLSGVQ